MRVFVTDGHNRAALAITRSLGRLGHHVIVGAERRDSIAQASRYCRESVIYPDPVKSPDAFLDRLERIVGERRVDVLMPVSDITTFMVTGQRARFACAVPCASASVVERAANKADIVATAERIGVPVPRSVLVEHPGKLPSVDHLGFPLVIKPWKSRIRTADGWASTSVSFADDHNQLTSDLNRRAPHEFPVLIQERVTGPGMGVFACYHDGTAVALFSHRRLRERPPWGGVSVLCASAEMDPVAGRFATRLLDAIGWQGVAMVEFKRDERDGLPKLMEINGRFWGSLQLAIDAGVDFPALLLQTVQDRAFAPQVPYRVGVRERWLWGDVDALLVSLRPGANAQRLAGRSRVRAIRDFLQVWGADLHYDNPKADDLRPFMAETRTWVRNLSSGVPEVPVETGQAPAVWTGTEARHVRLSTSFEDAGLDEAAWNELVTRGGTDSVFQTYQWARSWWATYAKNRSLLLVTASEGARVRALTPLVIDHRAAGDRVACFLGFGRADYSDVLSPAGQAPLVEAMMNELLESNDWDRLDLHNIPARSESLPVIQRCCERAGFPVIADGDMVCPTLLIDGHENEALKILNKSSLRRRQNGFARNGSLTVRHLTHAADIEPLLDCFFDQHVRRWAPTSSPSLFVNPQNREFYRQLTGNLSSSGWLLFTVVEHDGHPIAFHYGFDRHGVVTWYKPSFDPAFASRSPGLTLLRYLIEYAVTKQRRELDFSLGDEAFKSRFTNCVRRTVRLHVYRDAVHYGLARARRSLRVAAGRMVFS